MDFNSAASLPNIENNNTDGQNAVNPQPSDPIIKIDEKIKFWKRLSIILGLVAFFGYIAVIIGANVLAHGAQFGWVIFMLVGVVWQGLITVLFILSLTCIIIVIILSSRRKKHLLKDYAVVIVGLALIFSPYAISGILSFFRITWNKDDSVSVTVKSKDPYHISGDSSWFASDKCAGGQGTSNDLKNVDADSYYDYVDGTESRKLFAAEKYVEEIGNEILCQVGKFYKNHGRYPNANEIKKFSSRAINDDVRNGIYNIKLDVGEEPNDKDFTILFDKTCTNKPTEAGNVVVLSPLYGGDGRYCVYNDIDEILDSF